MTTVYDLTGGDAQNVLRHLDPWGRTQAALAIKPWSRLGTLPARKLVLVGSQFDATPEHLAQLAAAAPGAQELQLYLDATVSEGTVASILERLRSRSSVTSLLIAEVSPYSSAPPTAPMWGPSLHHLAPYLTSFTLHISSPGFAVDDLRHLLCCQHLTHLKLTEASLPPTGSNLRGLDAAGLLVVAQLRPLTTAELVLDVDMDTMEGRLTLEQLLEVPAVAPVVDEVVRITESDPAFNLVWAALQVFQRRHGSTLRRLSLASCVGGESITWGGPWDMPRLEHYSGDNKIQLDFEEVPSTPACSSSLTSLQLEQRMTQEVWEVLPQRLPKLQLLDVHDKCTWDEQAEAVVALQGPLQGIPAGIHSLGALDCLRSLRWRCLAYTALNACSHLTQLRDLELVAQSTEGQQPTVQLGDLGDLVQLTRLHIAGASTWKVEESSWGPLGLSGKLPHLKHLHVAASMTGQVAQLPGTALEALHLHSSSNSIGILKLVGAALPTSLTRLQLKMVRVTDTATPGEPFKFSAGELQGREQEFTWEAPPLQLPHLKELWLSGTSTWMPARAFSASPITSLHLLAGLPGFITPPEGTPGRQLDLDPYCQALPLLQELHVDMSTGHGGYNRDPEPLPDFAPVAVLKRLACLRLVGVSFAEVLASPDGAPFEPILQSLPQLTRLELLQQASKGMQPPLLLRRGLHQALKACRSLRVLQLHPVTMFWKGELGPGIGVADAAREDKERAYKDLELLLGNCVVLPFNRPLCGQL